MPVSRLYLEPLPPFRLDLTVWVLKRRPENILDDWRDGVYRRSLRIEDSVVGAAIRQIAPPERPVLEVTLTTSDEDAATAATQKIERILGTTVDLSGFYARAETDERLRRLAQQFAGFKPTRYPTMFECLTNAIACQLVSLNVGLRVVSRLIDRYGQRVGETSNFPPAFPTPDAIALADPDRLRELGMTRQKARALIELARGIIQEELDLGLLADLDDEAAVRHLTALRGVGRWTAEYALLRGMGRLNVFPGDDVGARNNLRRWLGSAEPLGYEGVRHELSSWAPYGGLIYFQMLLLGLESKGLVDKN